MKHKMTYLGRQVQFIAVVLMCLLLLSGCTERLVYTEAIRLYKIEYPGSKGEPILLDTLKSKGDLLTFKDLINHAKKFEAKIVTTEFDRMAIVDYGEMHTTIYYFTDGQSFGFFYYEGSDVFYEMNWKDLEQLRLSHLSY